MEYKQEEIKQLADKIKLEGFRVFIAERGHYGFYTDKEGRKLISFQIDLLSLVFSGNYTTDNPQETGSGWRIEDSENSEDFVGMFKATPPMWAVGKTKSKCSQCDSSITKRISWRFTTVKEHLKTYQKSSVYKEV